jgi:hypothetical protein
VKNVTINTLWFVVTIALSCASVASPFQLVCKSQDTEMLVPLSVDLERQQASFGGIEERQPLDFQSDRFIVWSKVIQYSKDVDNSSVSFEIFMFDRLNGELTTEFASTDKPMNEMLGETLFYSCRKDEKVL